MFDRIRKEIGQLEDIMADPIGTCTGGIRISKMSQWAAGSAICVVEVIVGTRPSESRMLASFRLRLFTNIWSAAYKIGPFEPFDFRVVVG